MSQGLPRAVAYRAAIVLQSEYTCLPSVSTIINVSFSLLVGAEGFFIS